MQMTRNCTSHVNPATQAPHYFNKKTIKSHAHNLGVVLDLGKQTASVVKTSFYQLRIIS